MTRKYVLEGPLTAVPADKVLDPSAPVVIALSPQEFVDLGFGIDAMHAMLEELTTVENTYLDVFPDCLLGSFAVPNKNHVLGDPVCFAFYLDKSHLVFLDEDDTCARLLDLIAEQGYVKEPTVAHCLFEFMKLLVKDDLDFLAELEDKMEDVEEAIIDRGMEGASRQMLSFRRKLLRIDTYYQQLVDMASSIAENENKLLTHEETRLFLVFERQAERLLKRSLTLKEYSLQLRELYQTQIDIKQNDTMQFFTVITTLFAPLTLITSWFGMNFANMPGLDWSWGYYAVIGVSLVIVIFELIIFKRKNWL
ncbi:CorA family divalent cation transporter [Eggerthella sp. YY7918]|uniref:magnesium transporter CorA family protein n=1 Tax=Eggerthella sp. (strain YY7918) TaxID=502558 RepID=UPI000217175A|nr:CorA family divalent cation transporter [Eggerthella sp. YY7918]BAK45607.1 Mg2+ and Co2+ transporter [Eggerthella sp. YY7918]